MSRDHPRIVRLTRVLEWAEAQWRRRMDSHDIAGALRVTEFACKLEAVLDQLALVAVGPYRDHS